MVVRYRRAILERVSPVRTTWTFEPATVEVLVVALPRVPGRRRSTCPARMALDRRPFQPRSWETETRQRRAIPPSVAPARTRWRVPPLSTSDVFTRRFSATQPLSRASPGIRTTSPLPGAFLTYSGLAPRIAAVVTPYFLPSEVRVSPARARWGKLPSRSEAGGASGSAGALAPSPSGTRTTEVRLGGVRSRR